MSKTILLLAASPVDQAKLRLDVEAREIDEGLRRSVHRDQFQLEKKGAVQTDDLRRALLDNNNIKILHFCGHGTGSDGLVFEDQQGKAQLVSTEALASLFQLFAGQIECVVLNACYSEVQAQAIVQHVGYVIGMNKAIGDKAAIKFSIGFYDALGGGRSFEDAYKFGCNAIQSEGIPEHLTPVLKINTAWKYVLEEKSKNPPNISKDSSSTSAEPLDLLSPMNKNELLDILERIIQAEFDQLLFKLNVPGNLMPGSDKSQTQRAIALLEWAESPKGCGLKKIWDEVSPTNSNEFTTNSFEFTLVTIKQDYKGEWILYSHPTQRQNKYFRQHLENGISLDMVQIPRGTFTMGAPTTEEGSIDWERPQHQVIVPSFFMGKYPITQAQWRTLARMVHLQVNRDLDPDPSYFKGDNRPVERVSWYDAVEFCDRLSKYTNRTYRLPSEAEWEYACRAGTTTPFHFGNTITSELANYNARSTYGNGEEGEYCRETTPVGSFKVVNAFGLSDMHGNVWEWCLDDWHSSYKGAPTDGSAWFDDKDDNLAQKTGNAVQRGGSWVDNPIYCHSAFRAYNHDGAGRGGISDDCGFRVVCAVGRT